MLCYRSYACGEADWFGSTIGFGGKRRVDGMQVEGGGVSAKSPTLRHSSGQAFSQRTREMGHPRTSPLGRLCYFAARRRSSRLFTSAFKPSGRWVPKRAKCSLINGTSASHPLMSTLSSSAMFAAGIVRPLVSRSAASGIRPIGVSFAWTLPSQRSKIHFSTRLFSP